MQSQNYTITQGYQTGTMKNEIPLPYYLKQNKIKSQLTDCTQKLNTAESIQVKMKFTLGVHYRSHLKNHLWYLQEPILNTQWRII